MPPCIHRPSPARWRPVNMWGTPSTRRFLFFAWVPTHIQRPQIFRCLRPGSHLFLCSPLVEGVPPHFQRPSHAKWRPVNMWGHPFYQEIISVVTLVPPHIHRPQIARCLLPGSHLFLCSLMHWTTIFCIGWWWTSELQKDGNLEVLLPTFSAPSPRPPPLAQTWKMSQAS